MATNWPLYTQRFSAGAGALGQALKTYAGKQALSAVGVTSIPLETVTAGKTFFITDIYISHDSALVLDAQITAAGTRIFGGPCKGDTAPIQMPGMETQPSASSGQAVALVLPIAAGPPNVYFYIAGYEQ